MKKSLKNPSSTQSLSLIITIWLSASVAILMLGYAVFQKVLWPETSWLDLFLHHFWHVIVFGVTIQLSTWIFFRYMVEKPLNEIFFHLYKIGKGQLEPLNIASNIRELDTIADGVNILIWRITQGKDDQAISDVHNNIASIRAIVGEHLVDAPDVSSKIENSIDRLEQNLTSLSRIAIKQALENEPDCTS